MNTKQKLYGLIEDTVSDFLYYDRKEDEEFPVGYIDIMVEKGDITVEEIVAEFDKHIRKGLYHD